VTESLHGGLQQASHQWHKQESLRGLLQGGEMRNLCQPQKLSKIRVIGEKLRYAPIVGLEKDLQNEAGKQLRLRVDLWTEPM
jgi:hypothetical protein